MCLSGTFVIEKVVPFVIFLTSVLATRQGVPKVFSWQVREVFGYVIPQNWGFFTNSPRNEVYSAYTVKGDAYEQVDLRYSMGENFLLGSRRDRFKARELGILSQQLNPNLWTNCGEDVSSCTKSARTPVQLVNNTAIQHLCGDLAFRRYKIHPFAWSSLVGHRHPPFSQVNIKVDCPGGRL